ncbi:MAG: hydroxymethylglutaryl-CoA lyase [Pseudomonadota bacterium]
MSGDLDVDIQDVGPRDGLQNEPVSVSTGNKIAFIDKLVAAGARRLEVASFVNPKRVPRMADAEAVIDGLTSRAGVLYSGLVLNQRGLGRAKASGLPEIGVVAMATDGFGLKNQGQTAAQSVAMAQAVTREAKAEGIRVVAILSASFGCPFEGVVDPGQVAASVAALAAAGPDEITLADTIGAAAPGPVADLVKRAEQAAGGVPLRCHFHNTRGAGLANVYAALEQGVRRFDASLGGIGGCPFAPRATGNIATEDLAHMLEASGLRTGFDIDALIATTEWLETVLGRATPALTPKAGRFPPKT